jgi:UDP-N-acetylmuramate dehydrogenase
VAHPCVREQVPLAPLTTLALGGPAERLVRVEGERALVDVLRTAGARGWPVTVLGGGSNVVVADEGIAGLVVQMASRGVSLRRAGDAVIATVGAGEPWDALVARTVGEGLAGLECLSGIPGLVGAAPVQNVGAYGQEVSETVRRVRVVDRTTLQVRDLSPAECAFGYRDSALKRAPGRFVVVEVDFALRPGGAPAVRYVELVRAVGGTAATLERVRSLVWRLRQAKGMVLEDEDPERRTAGSFFTNPVVDDAQAAEVIARAVATGVASGPEEVPTWPAGEGRTKLAAGWLIERAGLERGLRRGAFGISRRHALALVHHGGGHTRDLLALAQHVRDTVDARFGVQLRPEPVLLGAPHPLWDPLP